MEQQACLQLQPIDSSNCQQLDEQQAIIAKGTVSVLKNQTLISLLSTHMPFNRTEKECRTIAQMLKLESYFESMSKNFKTLLEISSWIQYKQAQGGEYIYRVHDVADSFYILLQGDVHLTYPQKEVLELQVNSLQQNDANSTKNLKESAFYPTAIPTMTKHFSTNLIQNQQETIKPKRLTRHESLLTTDLIQVKPPSPKKILFEERIVQIVANGQSFGDLGDSNRRGTNALAKQLCHLLLVKKQNYSTLSNAQVKSQGKQKFELLSSIPLFKLVYRYALQSLIYLMAQHKLGYNNILYNEDDPTKYVYIIFKGEFKLYKKVVCKKEDTNSSIDIQERVRNITKNTSFKTIQLGEILGYCEAYQKLTTYQQTCVCKSQDGIVLRIEKNKFMKKILSTENNLQEIIPFIEQKCLEKSNQLQQFLKKYQNNHLFKRYLHTPSAKSRRVNTETAVYKQKFERQDQLRKLSTASNNFFNEFNKTVKQSVRSTRISVKKSIRFSETRQAIPSRIKDIIGIVQQQTNYYKIRKPKENITLFDFNISKVPIHVKKKYEILFKKQNK